MNRNDIDGTTFYLSLTDPELTFNRTEITLSHIFRSPHPLLGGDTYSDKLFSFLNQRKYLRREVLEVGAGLGDVAFNFLTADAGKTVDRYRTYDISPKLLARQEEKLRGLRAQCLLGNSLELSRQVSSFDGTIISNGMIADLRSVQINGSSLLADYGITDSDLVAFAEHWGANRQQWYFNVGACLFIRELATSLAPGGTAAILEYSATEWNQPSWFDNHFECGIDFAQLTAYASRLGFETEVVSIDEILGLPEDHKILTVDVFTRQSAIARTIPGVTRLWSGLGTLPVLAYCDENLASALEQSDLQLSKGDRKHLYDALRSQLYSIHDLRFDSKNPTTWGYQCLLLRKTGCEDWREKGEGLAVLVIQELFDLPEEEARKLWREAPGRSEMSALPIDPGAVMASFVAAFIYDLLKNWGEGAYLFFIEDRAREFLRRNRVPQKNIQRIAEVFTRAAARLRLQVMDSSGSSENDEREL